MIYHLRRVAVVAALFGTLVLILTFVPQYLKPTEPDPDERERDQRWVNSSPNWLDRQTCRWLGLCGIMHIKWDAPALPGSGFPDDAGDLGVGFLQMLALGWSAERKFVEMSDLQAWETAPLRRDSRPMRRRTDESGDEPKILQEVPDYVLQHAPLVHLYSGENFWPSDIIEHVRHLVPYESGRLLNRSDPIDLANMGQLNAENCTVFMTSEVDVETRPSWLHNRVGVPVPYPDDDEDDDSGDDREDDAPIDAPDGEHNWGWRDPQKRPTDDGTSWWNVDKEHPPHRISDPRRLSDRMRRIYAKRSAGGAQRPIVGSFEGSKPDPSGYSKGPAVLVMVDKGAGIVDAFWFFFYSYNLGQTVLDIRFGNHVGDWEHCMIRFEHGIPRAMFLSEHAGGQAYAWQALEKRKQKGRLPARPVIYSAVGSHAMYATPGLHPYVLPFKMLKDVTDKGPLWDPSLNHYAFWYDYEVDREEEPLPPGQARTGLQPAASNPDLPTSWFHFEGYWGDDVYPLSDRRQWRVFGEYHYITGPLGPKFKNLDRSKVCQMEKCRILYSMEAGKKSTWYS